MAIEKQSSHCNALEHLESSGTTLLRALIVCNLHEWENKGMLILEDEFQAFLHTSLSSD